MTEHRNYHLKHAKLARVAASMAMDGNATVRELIQWACGFPSRATIHEVSVSKERLTIKVSWEVRSGV